MGRTADRILAILLVVGTFVFAPAGLQAAGGNAPQITLSPGTDYFGFDYDIIKDTPLENCISSCRADQSCMAFTYNQKSRWCFLKSDYSSSQPFAGTIAGRKITAKAISGTRKPNPDPAFLSKAIRNKADTLPRRMKGWYKPQKSGFVSLRRAGVQALRAKKIVPAARFFGRALALYTDDPAVLLAYSRAISSQPNLKGKKRRLVQEVATSAALLAYRAAATPAMRAKALNTLAKMLVARKYWWSAINSYKLSLSLVHDPSIQQKLTELRENHGFRITKHDVDSDTANPRICIRFSENLKAKTDFTPFIRIDGKVPEAVKQKGSRQLCLEGVRHAASYSIDIRAGLPSSIAGETLARTVNIKAYIRDRAAAVRFTGNGFVLPRIGSEGIPVVSVNTSEIDIEIYRVDERNLTTILKNDRFGRQISPYRATRIGESSGEKIWNGKLEVAEKRNQEVTTSFPITEALPIRKPGVYVMMARPAQKKTQDEYVRATQWFVISDIGLTSFSGADGLHVFTRSLSTAQTLPHVKLRLVARNNTVLATAQSDEQGYARFAPGLIRGEGGNAPKILIAEGEKGDTVLIDLAKSAFDLSDRGVSGRAAPPPMDAYLYTERGIYRPGSAVHAVTLLRDPEARAISNIPLTLIVSRPDGVEYRRYKLKDSGQGSYMKEIPLIRSVMRGTWQIAVYSDPKKDPLAQTSILVEDFVPDRFEFDLTSPAKWLSPRQETALHLSGRYLYGAPAADLRLTGDIRILSARELPGFAGYRFGLADEEKQDDMNTLDDLPRTDAAGAATIRLRAPDLPVTTGPLKARVSIRMIEAGGRAVERAITLPVQPQAPMIGIRPLFEDKRVGEGETAKFDVLAVGRDGKTRAMGGLKWELVKLERSFQWYRSDGEWNYESVEYTKRVANGRLDVSADKAARIAAKVDWGSYRLEISGEGEGAPASSFTFSAGWYSANANADTPDFLQIALDKPAYRAGERAKVKLSPRYDGMALVTVMGERLLAMKMVSVKKGSSEVEFTVGDDWGAGAYVTATLYRPMDVARSRNPARAMGVSWLDIDNSARTLGISLDLPDKFRSGKSLNLPVSLSGLEANEEAYLTLAAVDVGILNLTRFKPPAPESWYFGQRKLGMEIRDLYGRLINGMLGVRGKIRTGSGEDEGAEMSMQGTPPAQKPVSLFSGIIKVDAHGKAVITLDVPEFNGSLRLMAVAWSKSKVGHAARDLIVRDPVVMSASLPRFLAPGDASRLLLEFNNTDGPAGIYTLDLQMPPQLGLYEQKTSWSVNLPRGGKSSLFIPFFSRQVGVGTISLRLHNADGLEITRNLKLGVRAAQPVLSTRRILPLPAQGQGAISLNANMLTGLRPETASLSLSISRIGKLDLPGLLAGLDRYPYGCTEQITSRALPLLYLGDVAKSVGLNARAPRRERIQKAIDRVLTRQDYSGGFGLWRPDSDNLWLSAYVTDFLTRAREQSYSVPVKAFERALGNLENGVSYNRKIRNQGRDIAYALYVLARNGRASLGDLRYFADSRLKAFTSPMARAQLGAAFTYFGDRARATRLFKAAMALLPSVEADPLRTDFGSRLRDVAAVMALAAQSSPPLLPPASLIQRLDQRRAETPTASTQEKAWLLLAARALLKGDENISLKVNGKTRQGHLFARYPHSALTARPLNIVNEGSAPLQAVITTTGIPARPGPASGNGFSIERKIYNLKGEEVSTASLQQTSRLIVVLEVHEDKSAKSRLLVVDRLPAGFEIDNPSLMTSASLKGFDWLPESDETAHLEFRDDRFVAAIDRSSDDEPDFTLAYMVRAVSPGSFVSPPAVVEDMYRPYRNARTATGRIEIKGVRR